MTQHLNIPHCRFILPTDHRRFRNQNCRVHYKGCHISFYTTNRAPCQSRQPLKKTHVSVVTADHLAIRHLMTQTVGGFVGVHRHVQDIRWVYVPKVGGRAIEFSSEKNKKYKKSQIIKVKLTKHKIIAGNMAYC